MPDEGESPVERKTNDGTTLNPGEPWTPTAGQNDDLTIEFPSPAEVTSIRLTDDQAPLTFRLAYQSEEGAEFVPYPDNNGEAKVKESVNINTLHV